MSSEGRWDVVIVGAGPAGSTCAARLAQRGHRVVVLERSHFPRFRIGESLLPLCVPSLERLGVEPTREAFRFKQGAEFVCEATGRHLEVDFREALDGAPGYAWQVDRARFDTLLRDRAYEAGAEIRHGERVREVDVDEDDVRVGTGSGRVRGRYLVDATGQDRLLARRARAVAPYRGFGRAAVYAHYDGLSDEALEAIGPSGNIRVMIRPEGWAWVIPLPGRRLSVGVVTQQRGVRTELLDRYVASSPMLRRWTQGTTRSEPTIVRNFSYRNTASSGRRYACIGDASCFLDPVFSSGVSIAMVGAERLAEWLGPALEAGLEADPEPLASRAASMDRAYDTFATLIHRFYNTRFVDNVIFGSTPDAPMRRGVVSVLAGDVWRDDNAFQRILLRTRPPAPTLAERSARPA